MSRCKGIEIYDKTLQSTRSQLERLYLENHKLQIQNIRLKDEIKELTNDNIRQQNVILILDGVIKRKEWEHSSLPETANSTQD